MIEPDIAAASHQVAGGSVLLPRLLQAINDAEGGDQAFVRAIACSDPTVTTRAEALPIGARTVVHRLVDFVLTQNPEGAIRALGASWAPIGAENDPGGLNAHWVANVIAIFQGRGNGSGGSGSVAAPGAGSTEAP